MADRRFYRHDHKGIEISQAGNVLVAGVLIGLRENQERLPEGLVGGTVSCPAGAGTCKVAVLP